MPKTVEVPVSLLRKMTRAATAFAEFEDELEDFLLSRDTEFTGRMRDARAAHMAGQVRSLEQLMQELCNE
jgi:hypothetical protein